MDPRTLVLRLAGPLQSWGSSSQYNRRETDLRPSKSGVFGLLAAAQGLRRTDPIEQLLGLTMAVRVDQPGALRRDYHTVSDLRRTPLLSANTNPRGQQKPTSPKKYTHVTQRYYLEDACFVVAVRGDADFVHHLAACVRRPAFPLALGRRSCAPTQPIAIPNVAEPVWDEDLLEVMSLVPWMASPAHQHRRSRSASGPVLPVTYDDDAGLEVIADVPVSYAPGRREFFSRTVSTAWVRPPSGEGGQSKAQSHDPFELLGG